MELVKGAVVSYRPSIRGFQMLSPRETQLILLAGEGLTDKEIGRDLGISTGTVITLWSKVRAKLAISSRVSAVSLMASVVSRLTSCFPAFDNEPADLDRMLGELSGVRVVLNSRLIVLACSSRASALFNTRAGLSLSSPTGWNRSILDDDGQVIADSDQPWLRALRRDHNVVDFQVSVHRDGISEDFLLDCHVVDDPILKRVVVLDFRPVNARRAEVASRMDRGVASMIEDALLASA